MRRSPTFKMSAAILRIVGSFVLIRLSYIFEGSAFFNFFWKVKFGKIIKMKCLRPGTKMR